MTGDPTSRHDRGTVTGLTVGGLTRRQALGRGGRLLAAAAGAQAGASWVGLKSFKGDKSAQAREVGKALATAAGKAGIETVVFDRGGYLYHGRVKALADGAREGGLKF